MDLYQAAKVTLTARTVHEFGDRPYFAEAAAGMFVRVRVSTDIYVWTRILRCNTTPEPYEFRGKKMDLLFECDVIQEPVAPPALSNLQPTQEEVDKYLEAHTAVANVDELVAKFQKEVTHRELTPEDYRAIIEKNTKLNPMVGNWAVKSTVAMKKTQLARQLSSRGSQQQLDLNASQDLGGGLDESFSGASAALGHLLRTPSAMSVPISPEGRAPDTPRASIDLFNASQSSFTTAIVGDVVAAAAAAVEAPPVVDRNRVLRELDDFQSYVTNEERARQQNLLAELTQRNIRDNAIATLRGVERATQLNRKGNLLESTGLWVTDDAARAKSAAAYDKMKEEEEKAKDDKGGKKEVKAKVVESDEAREKREAEALLKTCLKARESQELNFDKEIGDIFAVAERLSAQLPDVDEEADTLLTAAPLASPRDTINASPNLLVGVSPKSLLLHRSIARKRPRDEDVQPDKNTPMM